MFIHQSSTLTFTQKCQVQIILKLLSPQTHTRCLRTTAYDRCVKCL